MEYLNKVRKALKEAYNSKKYFLVMLVATLIIFLFNTLVNNYKIFFSDFSFSLLFSLLRGTLTSMTAFSVVLLIVISVLAGFVTAMTVFLMKRQVKGTFKASSSSIFVSLITPTCPSCAIGLLSFLGLSGFLAVLPFKGLELGFVGIGLLGASIIYLSNKITTETCSIAPQGCSKMEDNNVSIKKSTIWKWGLAVLIVVLGFFVLRGKFWESPTSDVISAGNNSIQSAKLYMMNYKYQVEPAMLKKGISVRMIVDVDSLIGCAKSIVIKDFGIRKSVSKADNIIEFTPYKTGTINIACSMNMYHGTFTVIE